MTPSPFPPAVKHLVYLSTLFTPSVDAETLYDIWPKHPMFRDYPRPSARTIRRWREEWQAAPKKPRKQWIKI